MIHEFNPEIYPFRLWVSVNPTLEELSEKFYGLTDDEDRISITDSSYPVSRFSIATTLPVIDKVSGFIGVIVIIYRPKQFTAGVICHEVSHAVDFICEKFGITRGGFKEGEASGYLSQWVGDCIVKARNYKNLKEQ